MVVSGYNSNTPSLELREVVTGELWTGIAQSVRSINCWDVILVRGRNFLFVIFPSSRYLTGSIRSLVFYEARVMLAEISMKTIF